MRGRRTTSIRTYTFRQRETIATRAQADERDASRKFSVAAAIIGLMSGAFTAAQFIPAPEWMFANTGTLVVESNPQGVKVLVNGQPQGVTPLTLKVESGIHEVELHGPGKPEDLQGARHARRSRRAVHRIPRPPTPRDLI